MTRHPLATTTAKQPTDYRWNTPWPAWILAFRMRKSFTVAATFGGILALLHVVFGILAFAGVMMQSFGGGSSSFLALFMFILGALFTVLPIWLIAFLALFLASRFMDPEIRPFGGFSNLRFWPAVLWSALISVAFVAIGLCVGGLAGFLFQLTASAVWEVFLWVLVVLPLALVGFALFLSVCLIALRFCLIWPLILEPSRTPLPVLLRRWKFVVNLMLIGLSFAVFYSAMTFGIIGLGLLLTELGLGVSIMILAVIFLPFAYVFGLGYGLIIIAHLIIAPLRVAGWTLARDESLAALFE